MVSSYHGVKLSFSIDLKVVVELACVGFVRQKKTEENATFCSIKDGTFFTLFCLTNPAQYKS
jgi:hypothetical protein